MEIVVGLVMFGFAVYLFGRALILVGRLLSLPCGACRAERRRWDSIGPNFPESIKFCPSHEWMGG